MSPLLDVTSSASPASIADAIRGAGYWQESLVPPDLRKRGLFAVEVRVSGTDFEIVGLSFRDPPATEYFVRGNITPTETGGARVRAFAAVSRLEQFLPPVLFLLGAVFLIRREMGLALVLIGFASLSLWTVERAKHLRRDSDAAVRHLVERLEQAVVSAAPKVGSRAV